MTKRAKTSEDQCPICLGSSNTDTMVFHWAGPLSATMIAITCSDECSDKFEAARELVDGTV